MRGELRIKVAEKAAVIDGWVAAGRMAPVDSTHLFFTLWAATQTYADFDVQVRAVLGRDRGGEGRFEDAARFLETLFMHGVLPQKV